MKVGCQHGLSRQSWDPRTHQCRQCYDKWHVRTTNKSCERARGCLPLVSLRRLLTVLVSRRTSCEHAMLLRTSMLPTAFGRGACVRVLRVAAMQ